MPGSDPVAELPVALVDKLTAKPAPSAPTAPNGRQPSSRYGAAALAAEVSELRGAHNGTRNDALNRASFKLGGLVAAGAVDRADVERELTEAAAAAGLSLSEIEKTIRSGIEKGLLAPRTIEPRSPSGTQPAGTHEDTAEPQKLGEDDLRDRYLAAYPRTAYGMGEFHQYTDGAWLRVEADSLRRQIMAELEAAKAEGVRPSARLLEAVLTLVRVEVSQPSEIWDARTDLVPCRNGLVRWETGELLPHSPGYYFTTLLPFDYDPAACAGTWGWFIERTLPEAASFLQEFIGYCLTADTQHELAVWLHGPAGSGKSTCVTGVQTVAGPRAGILNLANVERGHFALAALPGKTVMLSTEQPADYIGSGATLNALISGEPVEVERKFRDAAVITPRVKLLWAMNSLPRVGDSSSGLFRRVKVVEFPALREAQRDPSVKARIAQAGPGILNWAIEGLRRLRQRGHFEIPAGVVEATEQFRQNNDVPEQFVTECCLRGLDFRAKASTLYKAYRDWSLETGHKPQSMTSLASEWRRLGFERYMAAGNVYWRGVGLKDE